MIEWIAFTEDGTVVRVDAQENTLYTSRGAHRVAVANVIPQQAPGQLALDAGLASGHGWCPIKPGTFESQLIANVHVIGDACIAGAMPKAASAAHSQAQQCARAIAALLDGRAPPVPALNSVCYSLACARSRAGDSREISVGERRDSSGRGSARRRWRRARVDLRAGRRGRRIGIKVSSPIRSAFELRDGRVR